MAMDIIVNDRLLSMALPLAEFEAGFKQLVHDAALRTKARRAAADAESSWRDEGLKIVHQLGRSFFRREIFILKTMLFRDVTTV